MLRFGASYKDHDEYKGIQVQRWKTKQSSASPLSSYREELEGVTLAADAKILCNGVRNMHEINHFRTLYPGRYVLGTDIAFASGKDVVQCDFSTLPKEWAGNFDLVYSNSLDHALDPIQALKEWRRVMKVGGWLVMRLAEGQPSASDINSFVPDDITLIEACGFKLSGLGPQRWPIVQFTAV